MLLTVTEVSNKESKYTISIIYYYYVYQHNDNFSNAFNSQMQHSFFFIFKILHKGFFTLKICMRIDIA